MARLKNMSLKTKLITTMAMMLILLAGALMVKSTQNTTLALHGAVDSENVIAINALAYTLADDHPGLTRITGEHPEDFTITWPSMPSTIAVDDVDSTQTITGLDPTVFKFDEGTRAFTRIGTTLRAPDGNRAVMTELAPGPAYDALVNGEIYIGHVDIQGAEYEALYVPVFDADGSVNGAFAVVRPLASVHAMIEQATVEAIAIAIGILLVALLVAFFTIRKMLAPITHMTTSIEDLSNGSLDSEIGYQSRSDEIGKISNSLVVLQRSMQQAEELKLADVERSAVTDAKKREQDIVVEALTEGLSRLGNLDLSKQIENTRENPFPSEYEELRTSFNMLVDNLSESLEAIREVATEVNNDAKEMAGASGDLSARTESQAATLEESAAALEEMSASVQSTAANASEAEGTTQENRTNAKRTGEIVDTAIDAMTAIEESSQKITQIISVIDDIAFQTNLLALNAGVEAARAGEAGRGFAVVASEVRALAQHSSSSAQEIKTLIASSSGHVENGSKLVRNAGESIGDIIEMVDRVSGLVSDIAVSAKEQSIGVTEITAAVRDLDAATQGNAAMAEETTAASEGLTGASDRLTNHLARFKLADTQLSNWAEVAASVSTEDSSVEMDDANAFEPMPSNKVASQAGPSPQVNAFQDF